MLSTGKPLLAFEDAEAERQRTPATEIALDYRRAQNAGGPARVLGKALLFARCVSAGIVSQGPVGRLAPVDN
ncbi:MAG: hypothetical protein JOZ99_06140 [Actinobacteria bacterium]|nr:hypothetical protein [Actinomycetota bacterium]